MQRSKDFKLRAKAAHAAIIRPLCRVERLTYDVPTPSAIVGIFEAVLWHPGLHWRPTLIEVLRPIRYFNMRTNEVTCTGSSGRPFNVEDVRTQRNTVGLYDVDYVFTAHFELDDKAQHNVIAFTEMFERYLKRGQLHHTPCFGMFPFVCDLMEAPESYQTIEQGVDRPLGPMLYGRNYKKSPPEPMMFDARLVNGTVRIPSYQSVVAAAQQ
jgi:CRISPR-associated protein Cas5d